MSDAIEQIVHTHIIRGRRARGGTMTAQNVPADTVSLHEVDQPHDLPEGLSVDDVAEFFHDKMKPYHDTIEDVRSGLDYAFSDAEGKGGFLIIARQGVTMVGGITILNTGMAGYIPEHVLLFVAVDPALRGRGIGERLIRAALQRVDGALKLHVEHDNPARRLYERVGFTSKYLEMRRDSS
ncbi:MAG: GNAT family N-acetyltransferase [Pseudomonadota bacterium]